jgi:hypothetical protein
MAGSLVSGNPDLRRACTGLESASRCVLLFGRGVRTKHELVAADTEALLEVAAVALTLRVPLARCAFAARIEKAADPERHAAALQLLLLVAEDACGQLTVVVVEACFVLECLARHHAAVLLRRLAVQARGRGLAAVLARGTHVLRMTSTQLAQGQEGGTALLTTEVAEQAGKQERKGANFHALTMPRVPVCATAPRILKIYQSCNSNDGVTVSKRLHHP